MFAEKLKNNFASQKLLPKSTSRMFSQLLFFKKHLHLNFNKFFNEFITKAFCSQMLQKEVVPNDIQMVEPQMKEGKGILIPTHMQLLGSSSFPLYGEGCVLSFITDHSHIACDKLTCQIVHQEMVYKSHVNKIKHNRRLIFGSKSRKNLNMFVLDFNYLYFRNSKTCKTLTQVSRVCML